MFDFGSGYLEYDERKEARREEVQRNYLFEICSQFGGVPGLQPGMSKNFSGNVGCYCTMSDGTEVQYVQVWCEGKLYNHYVQTSDGHVIEG